MKPLTKDDFEPTFNGGDLAPALTDVRCPKCRSADLAITEFMVLSTTFEVRGGRLNRANGIHEPGGSAGRALSGQCDACGHTWTLRRKAIQITDVATDLDPVTFQPLDAAQS